MEDANLVANDQQLSVAILGLTWARGNEDGVEEDAKAGVDEVGE